MMYEKPKDVTYTQMAIYIDQHAYDENQSEEKDNLIFEYLYHLIEMLAYKAKFFTRNQYYNDFALYVASSVFMRLKNPKQFQYNELGQPKIKRVKSILNYIKTILYPKKVDFEQEYYDQSFKSLANQNNDSMISYGYAFSDYLIDQIDGFYQVDFNLCLDSITATIKQYIFSTPFKNDSVFVMNLYFSCLLTFLSSITPRNIDLNRIANLKLKQHREYELDDLLENQFHLDDVILFHLDNNYKKYVYVLTKKIKHLIATDLSLILNDELGSESMLKSILINDIIDKGISQEED